MKWLVADTLSHPEQLFCSHVESFSHYLREAGEEVNSLVIVGQHRPPEFDVVFALDQYAQCGAWPAKARIAQVAAICNPMPWDVRKPDGSPAYDLVISSIPWMVEEARAKGCRAEYQALCFDSRALVCGMNVKERDIPCLFVGSRGANHQRRESILRELGDRVTVIPGIWGRSYFELLARAKVVIHCGAEWAKGRLNAMRVWESLGMGCELVADLPASDAYPQEIEPATHYWAYQDAASARWAVDKAVAFAGQRAARGQARVLQSETYVQRVPRLIQLAKELL